MKAFYRFCVAIGELWSRQSVPRHAAALAFFSMLTLAPLLLTLVGVGGYWLGGERVAERIVSAVRQGMGEGAARGFEQLIERTVLKGSGAGATLMGLLLALWGASGLMQSLKASLDALWDAPPHSEIGVKNWVITRLIGVLGVLLLASLLLMSAIFEVVLTAARVRLPEHLPGVYWLGWGLNRSLLPALLVIGNALLYWLLPAVRPRFRDALLGALVCTLLLLGMRTLISLYLAHSSIATLYGSAGSLVALLLWVYFSAQAFFLGAIIGIVRSRGSAVP
ncbi:MAG: hypothetical protein KatS3mg019_0144 [Fimbriimonadales bacterium]|nr:MAG: hypothetical protein KatS3mg019_0144 [Fimbriimonadales bacterium]